MASFALRCAIEQEASDAEREPEDGSENACTSIQVSSRILNGPLHLSDRLTNRTVMCRRHVSVLETHHLGMIRRKQRLNALASPRVLVEVHCRSIAHRRLNLRRRLESRLLSLSLKRLALGCLGGIVGVRIRKRVHILSNDWDHLNVV